jgi:hypothetical protein
LPGFSRADENAFLRKACRHRPNTKLQPFSQLWAMPCWLVSQLERRLTCQEPVHRPHFSPAIGSSAGHRSSPGRLPNDASEGQRNRGFHNAFWMSLSADSGSAASTTSWLYRSSSRSITIVFSHGVHIPEDSCAQSCAAAPSRRWFLNSLGWIFDSGAALTKAQMILLNPGLPVAPPGLLLPGISKAKRVQGQLVGSDRGRAGFVRARGWATDGLQNCSHYSTRQNGSIVRYALYASAILPRRFHLRPAWRPCGHASHAWAVLSLWYGSQEKGSGERPGLRVIKNLAPRFDVGDFFSDLKQASLVES